MIYININGKVKRLALSLKPAFARQKKYEKDEKEAKNEEYSAAGAILSSGGAVPLEADARIFKLFGWVLPVALGVTAGWFGTTCLDMWLGRFNDRTRPLSYESYTAASAKETDTDNMMVFLNTNPFKVSPMPEPELETEPEPEETEESAPPPVVGSLATAVLKGTSPGYIAWLEDQGKLKLVMVGDSFDVYTLEDVTYLDATFVNGAQRVVKKIFYDETEPVVVVPPPPAPNNDTPRTGRVVPPDIERGLSGVVSRNLINQMLEDPFKELSKVRIRPVTDGQGLRVEWINNDSILGELGLKGNDVVQSINGIVFRNAMDVSNSLNSLIASDQFIVDVVRDGQPITLAYDVR